MKERVCDIRNPAQGWIVTLVPKALPRTLQGLAGPEILYRAWHMYEI
jgi:hypothetical protein